MALIDFIRDRAPELRAVFEDLHRHPEIGFQERRTAGIVVTPHRHHHRHGMRRCI